MVKTCTKCKIEKGLPDFNRCKKGKYGVEARCRLCQKEWREANKECLSVQKREYYEDNRERIKNKMNKRYQENKAAASAYGRERYKKNREILTKNHIKYHNNRIKTDISYKLSCYLRSRLRYAIKSSAKKGSAVRDLGCSVEFLKKHLESQFQEGMTWANHGKWHIDHKRPLSKFDLTDREQLLEACHYTNLQPLWAIDNLIKSNKVL